MGPDYDISFNHDDITEDVNKFNLLLDGCCMCSPLVEHFADTWSLHDKLSKEKITWVPHNLAKMSCPHPKIKIPVWDPSNINVTHSDTWPRSHVKVHRLAKIIGSTSNSEFIKIAMGATSSILKSHHKKPFAMKEIDLN